MITNTTAGGLACTCWGTSLCCCGTCSCRCCCPDPNRARIWPVPWVNPVLLPYTPVPARDRIPIRDFDLDRDFDLEGEVG
jgi:hypothetical protein